MLRKKSFLLLTLLATMSFVGCHKEETPRCGGENPITFYSNIPGSYMSAPESRV